MMHLEENRFQKIEDLTGKITAVFVRGKIRVGFEISGEFLFDFGKVRVTEATDSGDFEFTKTSDFKGDAENYIEKVKASMQAFVESQ